ncbi:hypothetical protein FRB96_008876 [Tulasnella sp. 330]|nr:hypothetical protein FRB96_008876 [Tulasnella sp. 330]KAG8881826.1 hypothetical protein FRB97_009091 [Tulasnella sp. 331]KAG8887826.1 hypothetical protein FRB98_008898 [Tulasnella sp. 332]
MFNYPTPRLRLDYSTPRQDASHDCPTPRHHYSGPLVPGQSGPSPLYPGPMGDALLATSRLGTNGTHPIGNARSTVEVLSASESIFPSGKSRKYQRRGSQSSEHSSASSSFREYFSSSSSGSDDHNANRINDASSKQEAPLTSISSLPRKMANTLGLGKTQREIRRIVPVFLAAGTWNHTSESVRAATQTAAETLLRLCADPRSKVDIIRRLTKRSSTRMKALLALFVLSDAAVERDIPLMESATPARLLDLVMGVPKMGLTVAAYLVDDRVAAGAAGVRYLLRALPPSIQLIPHLDSVLLAYVERLSINLKMDLSPGKLLTRPISWILRLLELMLQRRTTQFVQLMPETVQLILSSSSSPEVELPPLQVIRSLVGAPPAAFQADLPSQTLVKVVMRTGILGVTHEARCLAFSALAVILGYCSPNQRDDALLPIAVDVILWQTTWQHSFPKAFARSCDIPLVIPHDDAYAILSLYPPPSFIPLLHKSFEDASGTNSFTILEPLISLIVDHSAEPDLFWPTMRSALIEAGLVDYLMKMAVLPLPEQENALYRVVQGAKRDAVTGVYRCFEQMSARDVKHVEWRVFDMLEDLMMDEDQPLTVQDLARIALETWDGNMRGIRPQKPSS